MRNRIIEKATSVSIHWLTLPTANGHSGIWTLGWSSNGRWNKKNSAQDYWRTIGQLASWARVNFLEERRGLIKTSIHGISQKVTELRLYYITLQRSRHSIYLYQWGQCQGGWSQGGAVSERPVSERPVPGRLESGRNSVRETGVREIPCYPGRRVGRQVVWWSCGWRDLIWETYR